MKFQVSFKDPDTLLDSIQEAVDRQVDEQFADIEDMAPDDLETIKERRREKVSELCCSLWFSYGEYVDLEIDTVEKTCRVIPRKESGR